MSSLVHCGIAARATRAIDRLTVRDCFCTIGVRLLTFLQARKYQLFDNRMIHARTRLVLAFRSGCTGAEAI